MATDFATDIKAGDLVTVVDAFGQRSVRRAASGRIERGHDFPVVLVCSEGEWDAAQREQREPDVVPWPAEDVSLSD